MANMSQQASVGSNTIPGTCVKRSLHHTEKHWCGGQALENAREAPKKDFFATFTSCNRHDNRHMFSQPHTESYATCILASQILFHILEHPRGEKGWFQSVRVGIQQQSYQLPGKSCHFIDSPKSQQNFQFWLLENPAKHSGILWILQIPKDESS